MQTIVTNMRGVCLSVSLSVTVAQLARLHCAEDTRYSLCQITLASCFINGELSLYEQFI